MMHGYLRPTVAGAFVVMQLVVPETSVGIAADAEPVLGSAFDPNHPWPEMASAAVAAATLAECTDETTALLQTNVPWSQVPGDDSELGANAVELGEQGEPFCIIGPADLDGDLDRFDKIILSAAQTQGFYDALFPGGAVHAGLSSWVDRGGVLVANLADRASGPGNGGSWQGRTFVGGLSYVPDNSNDSDIERNHPVLEGWQCDQDPGTESHYRPIGNCGPVIDDETTSYDDLDGWGWSHHGYFTAVPDGARTVLNSPGGGPVLVEYPYGDGYVLATMTTSEFRYTGGFGGLPEKPELTANLVAYRPEPDVLSDRSVCTQNVIPPGNDSSGQLALGPNGFLLDGAATHAWVNRNGTITFDGELIDGPTNRSNAFLGRQLLAPFWSDVHDERGTVSYGIDVGNPSNPTARQVLCAQWTDVVHRDAPDGSPGNTFQVLMYWGDPADDIHIDFSYETINWDGSEWTTTTAEVGWRLDDVTRRIAGSGVGGVFVDDGLAPLVDRGSSAFADGRWHVRTHEHGGSYHLHDDDFTEDGLQLTPSITRRTIGRRANLELPKARSAGDVSAVIIAGPNAGAPIEVFADPSESGERVPGVVLSYRGIGGPGVDIVKIDHNSSLTRHTYATVTWVPGPVQASLGDSYSAGEGIHGADDGGYLEGYDGLQACHRSAESWPASMTTIGSWRGHDHPAYIEGNAYFAFLACTGAKTVNVHSDPEYWRRPENIEDTLVWLYEFNQAVGPKPDLDGQLQGEMLQSVEAEVGGVDLITMTIGGNDAEWIDLIKACVKKFGCFDDGVGDPFPEDWTYRDWAEWRLPIVLNRVEATIRDLQAISPNATIVLSGYPQVFPARQDDPLLPNPQMCDKLGALHPLGLEPVELDEFRLFQQQMDDNFRQMAAEVGVHYFSVIDTFAGHEICGPDGEWINFLSFETGWSQVDIPDWVGLPGDPKLTLPIEQDPATAHPKAEGHAAWAETVDDHLQGLIDDGFPLNEYGIPVNPEPLAGATQMATAAAVAPATAPVFDLAETTIVYPDANDCGGRRRFTAVPGGAARVISWGFEPGSPVMFSLRVDDSPLLEATEIADPAGAAKHTFSLPVGLTGEVISVDVHGGNADGVSLYGFDAAVIAVSTPPCLSDDVVTVPLNGSVVVDVLANDATGGAPIDPLSVSIDQGFAGTADVNPDGSVTVGAPRNTELSSTLAYEVCTTDGVCAIARVIVEVDLGCTVVGTPGDDVISGTAGVDVICGLGGDDILVAGPDDIVVGGPGDDVLLGDGAVLAIGGTGSDRFVSNFPETDAVADEIVPDPGEDITAPDDDDHDVGIGEGEGGGPDQFAPVAVDDTVVVTGGSSVHITVLDNDSDPDGDLDENTLSIVTPPAAGIAEVVFRRNSAWIDYDAPTVSRTRTYFMTYEVCDLTGRCDRAGVEIWVYAKKGGGPIPY